MGSTGRETFGSGRLTSEQADWYQARFGERYSVVPDRPPTFRPSPFELPVVRANRKQRRAQRHAR